MREPAELADLRRVLSRRYHAKGLFQTQIAQASAFLSPSQAAKLYFLGTMHERLAHGESDSISLEEFRNACTALVQSLGPLPRPKVWNVTGPMMLGMSLFGFSFVFLSPKPFQLFVLPFFPISTLWLAGVGNIQVRQSLIMLSGLAALVVVFTSAPAISLLFMVGLALFEWGLARSPFWFVKAGLIVVVVGSSVFAFQQLGLAALFVVVIQAIILVVAFRKRLSPQRFATSR